MHHTVVCEQVGRGDLCVLDEDAVVIDEGEDVFTSITDKQAVVAELVARKWRLDDVPAQDLVPVWGVEEVVHVVESVLLRKSEDGVVGGGKDREVTGCVFVVVDDGLADEVVVEQIGVDLLLEQGMVWTVHHDLVNGRFRGGGRGHAVVDDVDDPIVRRVVGLDDVDPVDGQPARILAHQCTFTIQRGQHHARFQVFGQIDAFHDVVLQDVLEIGDGEHVELVQIHQVTQGVHRIVIGKEDGVFANAAEGCGAGSADKLHAVCRLPCFRGGVVAIPAQHQIQERKSVDGDGADHPELGLEADARIEVVDPGDVEGHDAHAGAFLRSLGLLEVELGWVVPRLAGERVGDPVDVVRALYVDEGYGFTWQDGELRRSEVVVGHHDGVVGFTLGLYL